MSAIETHLQGITENISNSLIFQIYFAVLISFAINRKNVVITLKEVTEFEQAADAEGMFPAV